MIEVERGVHLLREPTVRIIGDAGILLFEHDIELGRHDRVGEHQAGDAVGLERHHLLEVLTRDALKEAGIVAGGEGVLLPADCGDLLRECVAGILRRALEHQMFEKVREPGLARRLVGGPDLVPDHMRDHRRPVIGHHDDFKAVRQGEVRDQRSGPSACGTGDSAGERQREQQQFQNDLRRLAKGCSAPGRRLLWPSQFSRQTTNHSTPGRDFRPRVYLGRS